MNVLLPNCPWVLDISEAIELVLLEGVRGSSMYYSAVLIAQHLMIRSFVFIFSFRNISCTLFFKVQRAKEV